MSDLGIFLTLLFAGNLVFAEFLGLCPAMRSTERVSRALLVGLWLAFLMTLSSLVTWVFHRLILAPLDLELLNTLTFVVIVGTIGTALESAAQRLLPELYSVLKVYGTFVASNSVVLGIALIVSRSRFGVLDAVIAGVAAGAGVILAMLLLSALRVRLDREPVPGVFRGAPIVFISAGLIAMSFLAFDSALLSRLFG